MDDAEVDVVAEVDGVLGIRERLKRFFHQINCEVIAKRNARMKYFELQRDAVHKSIVVKFLRHNLKKTEKSNFHNFRLTNEF